MRILLVMSLLFAAAEARADCAIPSWVSAADGTPVPPKGYILVHDEMLHDVEVRWLGEPGSAHVVRGDGATVMLAYEGRAGTTLVIKGRYAETHYPLVADWKAPSRAPRVLTYWHNVHHWTCSYADSLIVQIDQPVAGIFVHWTHEGRTTEWLEAAQTDGAKVIVELGKIDCGGATISPDQLREGGELKLYAIRFNGDEEEITGLPTRIDLDEMPVDDVGVGGALTPLVSPQAAAPKHYGRRLGAVVLAILALGVLLGWRWRVRAPTVV